MNTTIDRETLIAYLLQLQETCDDKLTNVGDDRIANVFVAEIELIDTILNDIKGM